MLPEGTLPVSVQVLLAWFQPCFTAPSFRTFCGLACGFWAQTGRRTVCGMLAGAGLARAWPHDRAHYFFARARWQPGDLGLALARLVVTVLVPAGSRNLSGFWSRRIDDEHRLVYGATDDGLIIIQARYHYDG